MVNSGIKSLAIAFVGAAVAATLVLSPRLAAAQDVPGIPPQIQATNDAAPSSGVYVQDSATALDRMALAQRMENLKDWSNSADIYQEIIDKYRDRVVPSHNDDTGAVDQYASVLALVNQHMRAWPPEGLSVYEARFGLTARNLLRSAQGDNLAATHEVFNRYFITEAGKEAGLRLIDSYFELGDFPAAMWISQALLTHPNLDVERPGVLYRLGLAARLCDDDALAQSTLAELKQHHADAVATIGGQDVNLAAQLASDLVRLASQQTVSASQTADDSWPMPGGDASRGKISSASARPDARLYSVLLPPPNWKIVPDVNQRKAFEQEEAPWRGDGKALGIMPAADRGELFFQDNARIYALNLETGQPLPQWLATYPAQHGEYSVAVDGASAAISPPIGHQLPVTVTDTAVLAVMGLPDMLLLTYGLAGENDGKLVCLDRATGRQKWTVSARELPSDNLKTLRFGGAPLVAGNSVYLAAFNDKNNGYVDCYVVCFDMSGDYRWSTYVAGAPSAGQTVQNPNNQYSSLEVPTHLAYAGGRVFVATNVGAVAALDAYSGNVDWLNIYREPDDAVNPNNMPMMGMGWGFRGGPVAPGPPLVPPAPWTACAPIVHDGKVFVLPTDGKYVLVYDAGDGRLEKKLDKSNCCRSIIDDPGDTDASEPQTLLGVLDGATVSEDGTDKPEDLILLATSNSVCAVKWRQYDPANPSATIAWATAKEPNESIRGRPFLTADSVYIPGAQAFYRAALRNGKITQTYPAQAAASASSENAWPASEGPGNVVVCGDQVVVAGDVSICVYTGLDIARAKLQREIDAAPDDPNPRLHYAEVMSLGNQPDDAAKKLDEAMQLLAGQPAARDRAFADAMSFAAKSARDTASASAMFDRASQLVQSPGQQVAYYLARARYDRFGPAADLLASVNLYQGILADNALRTAPVVRQQIEPPGSPTTDADQEMMQAGAAAQEAIASIIQSPNGAAAYQLFEAAAQEQLAAALKASDPDRALAVAADYPNSSVVDRAESQAAALFESKGQPRQAVAAWRKIYSRLKLADQRTAALEAMARNELALSNGAEAAAARLWTAAQIDLSAKLLASMPVPGNPIPAAMPIAVAADKVARYAEANPNREADLPTFGLPSHAVQRAYHAQYHKNPDPFSTEAAPINDVDKLLVPTAPFARHDRIIAWTRGRGALFYSDTGESLGTDADVTDEPRGAAWVNDSNDLLVWTSKQLFLIDDRQMRTKWNLALDAMPALDVFSEAAPRASVNLITQMDPRLRRRITRNGLMPMRNPPFVARALPMPAQDAAAPASTADQSENADTSENVVDIRSLHDLAILSTTTGRVAAVNLADGSINWEMRFGDHAVDRVLATDDFTVVRSGDEASTQLLVLDSSDGRLLARRYYLSDQADYLVNFALGSDGTLACTTQDQINLYDLFDAASDPKLARPRLADASPDRPFTNMTGPDQLLVAGGQVLALGDGGGTLRGFSAQTGLPREFIQDGREQPMILSTDQHDDQIALRLGDRYVYAWSPTAIVAFDIEHPEVSWGPQQINTNGPARQMLLGKDDLILLTQPPDGSDPSSPWTLSAFSRALVPEKGTESGLLIYQPSLAEPNGITAWQPLEGGICYLAGDHTLHVLRGNTKPAAPTAP